MHRAPANHRSATRLFAAALVLLAACSPSRFLVVESDPPGAAVRLDEQILGRTPLEAPFEHYGSRRLTVYLEGYQTYSEPLELSAPWHARFPIDLFTEVLIPLGLTHRQEVSVVLQPDIAQAEGIDPGPVIERARGVRETVRRPPPTRTGEGEPITHPSSGSSDDGDGKDGDSGGSGGSGDSSGAKGDPEGSGSDGE